MVSEMLAVGESTVRAKRTPHDFLLSSIKRDGAVRQTLKDEPRSLYLGKKTIQGRKGDGCWNLASNNPGVYCVSGLVASFPFSISLLGQVVNFKQCLTCRRAIFCVWHLEEAMGWSHTHTHTHAEQGRLPLHVASWDVQNGTFSAYLSFGEEFAWKNNQTDSLSLLPSSAVLISGVGRRISNTVLQSLPPERHSGRSGNWLPRWPAVSPSPPLGQAKHDLCRVVWLSVS